jgi:hypothetical protein
MISKEYAQENRMVHQTQVMWGASAQRWLDKVVEWALHLGAKTVLDFGCGKGVLKAYGPKTLFFTEYDPGIPGKDAPPSPADMVACIDVLEHVEPEFVDDTLRELGELGRYGMFAVIALYPSGTWLSDGRNAHLSVHPPEWWVEKLKAAFNFPHKLITTHDYRRKSASGKPRDVLYVWMEKT